MGKCIICGKSLGFFSFKNKCDECNNPDKNTHPNPVQDKLSDPGQKQDNDDGSILLSTRPEIASFMYKYLMALTPVVLVIVSTFIRIMLDATYKVTSTAFFSKMPGSMGTYITQYNTNLNTNIAIIILMIAPFAVLAIALCIGWAIRFTEVWTGTLLTLGLSVALGILLANGMVSSSLSEGYILALLQWIAFLVQPFCFLATFIVIAGTEKFRRSIRYTVTKDYLQIRGGLWRKQEHMIPNHLLTRIVMEQDFFGEKCNYGTIIPLTVTSRGVETSKRGVGATGQKDKSGVEIGFVKDSEEGSRHPLDCLYGIPDPKKAQKILTGLIKRHDIRQEEQVSPLKKIYETNVAGTMTDVSGIQPKVSPLVTEFSIQDDTSNRSVEGIAIDGKIPESQETTIIRINDIDIPKTTMSPFSGDMREIPPVVKTKSIPRQEPPPAASVLDQIKKLAELRDSGIITEQEFTTKKTELLKRL